MDAQQQSAASFRATTFDNQLWSLDRDGSYYRRQSELVRLAAAAPPGRRKVARLNLARFYLARHMSAEAMGVLKVAFAGESDDVTGSVLKSVANIMLGRPKDAIKDLSQPQVGNQLDAPVWRAIAYARQGKWAEAHKLFSERGDRSGARCRSNCSALRYWRRCTPRSRCAISARPRGWSISATA